MIFRVAMTDAKSADRFETSQAVMVQEVLKVAMSAILLFWEEGASFANFAATIESEVIMKPGDTMKLAIPAVLYFVQNVCLQLGSANLPAAVFQVTYQGKTLVVALCSVVLLSKQLSRTKWLAIAVMGLGLAVVQLSNSTESKTGANVSEQSMAVGLIYVLVGCCCSGFAGVYHL